MCSIKKGLDFVRAIATKMANSDCYDQVVSKAKFISAGNGNIVAEITLERDHLNYGGGLHGGFTATLVDSISSLGLMTHEKVVDAGVNVYVNINYLTNAHEGDVVVVESKTVKAGGNLAFLECYVKHKKDDSVIATASYTKMLGDAAKRKSLNVSNVGKL